MKKLFRLMLLFWICLIACRTTPPADEVSNTAVPPTPITNPDIVEEPVEIVTPEPTPTTAVCTPLPDDMTILIRREEDLRGTIEVTGLQPDDRPILIITGEAPLGNYREETSKAHDVGPNGRFHHTINFKSWDSIEGYEFEGRLIHNRGVACFPIDLPLTDGPLQTNHTINNDIENPLAPPPVLTLADYPPNHTPYYIDHGDFWLVHTPAGQLIAFAPESPDYADHITGDECRFIWTEAVQRFVDPCSGDEWELNSRLNLKESPELWSNRDLDQYGISVQDGSIFVQFHQLVQALPVNEPLLAVDSQYGITVTAVTADFTPAVTTLNTLAQVDPIWNMDPNIFPPQQALTYPTFPNSLFDNQGLAIPSIGGEGGAAVFDPRSGGMKQMMHTHWEAVSQNAAVVTATLTVDLSNLHRDITLPLDWENHQSGDVWATEFPLEIGYAAAQVRQVEWVETTENGRARLRLTVTDDSPDDIRLYCLHLDTADPWQRTCANFDGELAYTIVTELGKPVALHLRAGLELRTPFQLAWKPPS
ncbi:MAG: hypothetical protein KC419_16055 [Anaerolineales bacterium]|nr:hypothetical protein [Anaerolineales bacterium]